MVAMPTAGGAGSALRIALLGVWVAAQDPSSPGACELRPGQTLAGKHIAGLKGVASAGQCCNECLSRSSTGHFCAAFTWHPSAGAGDLNCWLRASAGTSTPNASCISGVRSVPPPSPPPSPPSPPPSPSPPPRCPPVPRHAVLSARACGARGDGASNDTAAIREALAVVAAAGGGTVLLPFPGTYLSAPLVIGNDTELRIASGAVLLGSNDSVAYLPVWKRYDGAMALKPASLVSAGGCAERAAGGAGQGGWRNTGCDRWRHARNVSVTGGGTIDGGGQLPWANRPGDRPTLIEPYFTAGFAMRDITLQNSPFWTYHPTFCTDVVLERATLLGTGVRERQLPHHILLGPRHFSRGSHSQAPA